MRGPSTNPLRSPPSEVSLVLCVSSPESRPLLLWWRSRFCSSGFSLTLSEWGFGLWLSYLSQEIRIFFWQLIGLELAVCFHFRPRHCCIMTFHFGNQTFMCDQPLLDSLFLMDESGFFTPKIKGACSLQPVRDPESLETSWGYWDFRAWKGFLSQENIQNLSHSANKCKCKGWSLALVRTRPSGDSAFLRHIKKWTQLSSDALRSYTHKQHILAQNTAQSLAVNDSGL